MKQYRRIRTVCERQHRSLRMWAFSFAALVMLILTNTCDAHADEITTIESELTQDAMGPTINLELATNIWDAHESTPYALVEADSLELSIEAVLRALSVAGLEGAFIQSNIAIDDQAGISFSVNGVPCNPCSINFGNVPLDPMSIPEPAEWLMVLGGLDALLIVGWLRRRKHGEV